MSCLCKSAAFTPAARLPVDYSGGGPPTRQRRRRSATLTCSSGGSSSADAGGRPGEGESNASSSSGPRTSCSDASSSATTASSSSIGGSMFSNSPWQLLGRVVQEERVALQFDLQLNQGLIRSAAARESGLEYEQFDEQLQRLLILMPSLQDRILRMSPKLLAALAADPPLIAARLIQLKSLLPAADVSAVAGARPSLLLPPEWERVPAAAAQLAALYSEEEVAYVAEREPLLLAEDVDAVLAELQRFAGAGGDARAMLLRDPSVVYSMQRGTGSLGPGAEFM